MTNQPDDAQPSEHEADDSPLSGGRRKVRIRKEVEIQRPGFFKRVANWPASVLSKLRRRWEAAGAGQSRLPFFRRNARRLKRLLGFADGDKRYDRQKRGWSLLLGAIPAAICLAGIVVAVFGFDRSQGAMMPQYRAMTETARENKDEKLEEICLRRIAQGSISDMEKLWLVQLELKRNQVSRARERLSQMVTADTQGMPRAHLLMFQLISSQPNLAPEQFKEMEAHLRHCLKDDDTKYEANHLLGMIYWRTGSAKLAEEHLKISQIKFPDDCFALAAVLDGQGKNEAAAAVMREFIARLEPLLASDPSQELVRMQLSDAYVRLKDYKSALELLQDASALSKSPQLVVRQVVIIERWADYEMERNNQAEAFKLIQTGLTLAPNSPRFYQTLVRLAEGKGKNAAEATEQIEKLLAKGGPLSDQLHMILGNIAAVAGDYSKANRHYQIVFNNNPNSLQYANNLAYILAVNEPPQLDRALELINRAIEKSPNQPNFRDTRGQIYVKRKEWDKAIEDLEFAVRQMPNNANVHAGLALCYDAVGEKSLAEQHRQTAANLKKPAAKKKD